MRGIYLAVVLLSPILFALKASADGHVGAARTEVEKILQEQTDAWNARDADAFSRHFASDGTFTNILGMFMTRENGMSKFSKPFLGELRSR